MHPVMPSSRASPASAARMRFAKYRVPEAAAERMPKTVTDWRTSFPMSSILCFSADVSATAAVEGSPGLPYPLTGPDRAAHIGIR